MSVDIEKRCIIVQLHSLDPIMGILLSKRGRDQGIRGQIAEEWNGKKMEKEG